MAGPGATEEPLDEDELFLACTRPALFAGVPMEAVGINIILTTIIFIVMGNVLYAFIGIFIHLVSKEIVRHDYNAFSLLLSYVNTKGRALNARTWGGTSCTPLRLFRRYSVKDFDA